MLLVQGLLNFPGNLISLTMKGNVGEVEYNALRYAISMSVIEPLPIGWIAILGQQIGDAG